MWVLDTDGFLEVVASPLALGVGRRLLEEDGVGQAFGGWAAERCRSVPLSAATASWMAWRASSRIWEMAAVADMVWPFRLVALTPCSRAGWVLLSTSQLNPPAGAQRLQLATR